MTWEIALLLAGLRERCCLGQSDRASLYGALGPQRQRSEGQGHRGDEPGGAVGTAGT